MENSSSHFLVAFLFIVAFTTSMDSALAARPAAGRAYTKFIITSCNATAYPKLCYTSLSTHASAIRHDPKLLANTALSVTLDTVRFTSAMIRNLSHIHGMTQKQVQATLECIEELSDSVKELRKSMAEMNEIKGSNFWMVMSDVETWVSAALTDEDTCTDGLTGKVMNGNLKKAVRARIMNVAHLTSNALALINNYAALHN